MSFHLLFFCPIVQIVNSLAISFQAATKLRVTASLSGWKPEMSSDSQPCQDHTFLRDPSLVLAVGYFCMKLESLSLDLWG